MVVSALYENREKQAVGSIVNFFDEGRKVFCVGGGINFYTLLSTAVIKERGLYYLPLNRGGEDIEYLERIGVNRFFVPNVCSHPCESKNVHKRIERHVLYDINGLVAYHSRLATLGWLLFKLAISTFVFKMFMRKEYSEYSKVIIESILCLRTGKEFYTLLSADYSKMDFVHKSAGIDISFLEIQPPIRLIANALLKAIVNINKDVVVTGAYELTSVFLQCAFARKLYLRVSEEDYLLIADNSNKLTHFLKLAITTTYFPFFFLFLVLIFVPVKILRQPKTLKYGLD